MRLKILIKQNICCWGKEGKWERGRECERERERESERGKRERERERKREPEARALYK